jgi:hypothetical protein
VAEACCVRFGFHFNLEDAAEAAAALRREHDAVTDLTLVFEYHLVDVGGKEAEGGRVPRLHATVVAVSVVAEAGVPAGGQQRDFFCPPVAASVT